MTNTQICSHSHCLLFQNTKNLNRPEIPTLPPVVIDTKRSSIPAIKHKSPCWLHHSISSIKKRYIPFCIKDRYHVYQLNKLLSRYNDDQRANITLKIKNNDKSKKIETNIYRYLRKRSSHELNQQIFSLDKSKIELFIPFLNYKEALSCIQSMPKYCQSSFKAAKILTCIQRQFPLLKAADKTKQLEKELYAKMDWAASKNYADLIHNLSIDNIEKRVPLLTTQMLLRLEHDEFIHLHIPDHAQTILHSISKPQAAVLEKRFSSNPATTIEDWIHLLENHTLYAGILFYNHDDILKSFLGCVNRDQSKLPEEQKLTKEHTKTALAIISPHGTVDNRCTIGKRLYQLLRIYHFQGATLRELVNSVTDLEMLAITYWHTVRGVKDLEKEVTEIEEKIFQESVINKEQVLDIHFDFEQILKDIAFYREFVYLQKEKQIKHKCTKYVLPKILRNDLSKDVLEKEIEGQLNASNCRQSKELLVYINQLLSENKLPVWAVHQISLAVNSSEGKWISEAIWKRITKIAKELQILDLKFLSTTDT